MVKKIGLNLYFLSFPLFFERKKMVELFGKLHPPILFLLLFHYDEMIDNHIFLSVFLKGFIYLFIYICWCLYVQPKRNQNIKQSKNTPS